jgi:hypothetical protein
MDSMATEKILYGIFFMVLAIFLLLFLRMYGVHNG